MKKLKNQKKLPHKIYTIINFLLKADKFKKYIENNGINLAFQIIFAEIISKNIPESEVFSYSAERLKHMGSEMNKFTLVNNFKIYICKVMFFCFKKKEKK